MRELRVYEYSGCSTCGSAISYLKRRNIPFEAIPIVERPPTTAELKRMLAVQKGAIRKLFNTSGQLYREMKLGERLPSMSDAEAIALLAKHGKLVKRPFVLDRTNPEFGLLGFREDEWKKVL